MAEPTPTTLVSWTQLLTVVIPLVASSFLLPAWQMYLSAKYAKEVKANQELTHVKQDEQAAQIQATAAKVDELHVTTNDMKEQLVKVTDQVPANEKEM